MSSVDGSRDHDNDLVRLGKIRLVVNALQETMLMPRIVVEYRRQKSKMDHARQKDHVYGL